MNGKWNIVTLIWSFQIKVPILYIYCSIVEEIWRFIPPWTIIFPEGNSRGIDIFICSYVREINCLLHQNNTHANMYNTRIKQIYLKCIVILYLVMTKMT